MGRADFLRLGDFNAVCYQCGWKRKASEMEKNWQGYYVCPEHNEPRQTQDFVRAIPDNQTTPWAQPDPTVVYTFVQAQIGIGDGVTTSFQFGSGLSPLACTYIVNTLWLNGVLTGFRVTTSGLVTPNTVPGNGVIVTASGTETVLA